MTWNLNSWRDFPIKQQPKWENISELELVCKELSSLPALVFAGETRALHNLIQKAGTGKAFILQIGDCAENFDRCNGKLIHNQLKMILQMSIILAYGGNKQIVKIGRIAGQYAKPRSSDYETINNNQFLSYRGDMVNSPKIDKEARKAKPKRILNAYFRSAATLNLIRAFTMGGYSSLEFIEDWTTNLQISDKMLQKYNNLIDGVNKALLFANKVELNTKTSNISEMLFTSHEALILDYEEALTRIDTTTGLWYNTSAHFLWIGERTRTPEGAHVEFLRGVSNPIGIKIGPNYKITDIISVIQKLNLNNKPGRITLIIRFGSNLIEEKLPVLIKAVQKEKLNVTWICDPMHGNTITNEDNLKTRRFEDILKEIILFFKIHKQEKSIAGGIHLESTGEYVTECIGGNSQIKDKNLLENYQTLVDPRLNVEQSLEIAFEIASLI